MYQEMEKNNQSTGKKEYIFQSNNWTDFMIEEENAIWGRSHIYQKKVEINERSTQREYTYLCIYSYKINSKKLIRWLKEITNKFEENNRIKFNNNQKIIDVYYDENSNRIKTIINNFESMITFENNHFPGQYEIIKKIDFFQNREDFYRKRGIKRSLNILCSGSPGTGKTGITKAIINHTGRNVVMIKLSEYFPAIEIENILKGVFDDFVIDVKKTIFVIEEVDLISSFFNVREQENANVNTLGIILNAIDGIPECNGRMIIMTTNHPEKLDPAIKRPGRMDINYNVEKFTIEDIYIACKKFWGEELILSLSDISEDLNDKYVAAELMNKNISCNGDVNKIIQFLRKKRKNCL